MTAQIIRLPARGDALDREIDTARTPGWVGPWRLATAAEEAMAFAMIFLAIFVTYAALGVGLRSLFF